jgi:K+-sensing histidine kinase KdpD
MTSRITQMLVAFLVVGILVGALAGRMREREARARAREQETAALNRLSAAIVSHTTTGQIAETCLVEIVDLLGARSAAFFVLREGELVSYRETPRPVLPSNPRSESRPLVRSARATRHRTYWPPSTAACTSPSGLPQASRVC